jgi:hypothetical protein
MNYDEEPTEENKFYRVDWKYIDLDKGVDEDYAYVGAASPAEAVDGINGIDFVVREASKEEMEAYVSGYEDGYDIAILATRMEDLEAGMELDINDLSEEDL